MFSSSAILAQDIDADLKTIASVFDSSKNVMVVASVNVFQSKGGKNIYATKSSVTRDSNSMFTSLGEQEFFYNKNHSIHVDNEEKTIAVLKNKKGKNRFDTEATAADMKKLIDLLSAKDKPIVPKVLFNGVTNDIKSYTIQFGAGPIKKAKIFLNLLDFTIVKVVYEYDRNSEYGGQYIVIDYTTFDLTKSDKSKLQIENYCSFNGNDFELSEKYKKFNLIED